MGSPINHTCISFAGSGANTHEPCEKSSTLNDLPRFNAKPINEASPSSFWDKVIEKVKEIALVIFVVAVSCLLFWVNPTICALGFLAGIIFEDQVKAAIQKIKDVWSNQKIAGTLIGTFACALSMPVTLATASLLWSAHFGSLVSGASKDANDNRMPHLVEVVVG